MNSPTLDKKYNWKAIQSYYNNEHSINDCAVFFNIGKISLLRGSQKGLLKVRDKKLAGKIHRKLHKQRIPNTEFCKQLSIKQSLHNTGGKCKWFKVNNQKVQGTWERDICSKLTELGIEWIKPKAKKDLWPYTINNKSKHYAPDVFLPEYNLWLEIKGYWWGNDKEKMNIIQKLYPDRRILIITKIEMKKILDGELVW